MNKPETYPSATEEHLFSEEDFIQYDEASTGQRFVNYLIDAILGQIGIGFLTELLILKILDIIPSEGAYSFLLEDSFTSNYLLGIISILIYYTFCEKVFKGYTLGKLITGTRAIRDDGGELTLANAFWRSLSRVVPFEPISIWFGNGGPWHDTWTKTKVIKTR